MTWKTKLTEAELKRLNSSKAQRDKAQDSYNKLRKSLKSKAEWRKRRDEGERE